LITSLCSLIISDSVAVEIFAIGQPCAKIFCKVRCATFLSHGVFRNVVYWLLACRKLCRDTSTVCNNWQTVMPLCELSNDCAVSPI